MSKKTGYDMLDIMKWIAAWMVVIIHTVPLKHYSLMADTLTAQGICRIAVPFFFATSAFLLFSKADPADGFRPIGKFCVRNIKLYLLWSAIYFLGNCVLYFRGTGPNAEYVYDYLRRTVVEASHYHFWYLLASIYAAPLVFLIQKKRWLMYVSATVLWVLRCIQHTYSWTGVFRPQFLWLQDHFDALTNTLLCAIPLMIVGILAINGHKKHSNSTWLVRTIIWTILYYVELMIAYRLSPGKNHFEYLLAAPMLVYNLLCWLLTFEFSFKKPGVAKALRTGSVWIYCIHPMVILYWDAVTDTVGIPRFAVVATCCLLSSLAYVMLSFTIKRKKICA